MLKGGAPGWILLRRKSKRGGGAAREPIKALSSSHPQIQKHKYRNTYANVFWFKLLKPNQTTPPKLQDPAGIAAALFRFLYQGRHQPSLIEIYILPSHTWTAPFRFPFSWAKCVFGFFNIFTVCAFVSLENKLSWVVLNQTKPLQTESFVRRKKSQVNPNHWEFLLLLVSEISSGRQFEIHCLTTAEPAPTKFQTPVASKPPG